MKSTKRELAKKIENKRLQKTYKGEWYSINSLLGNDWAMFYLLLGGRGVGKSYSAMRWCVNRKMKLGDQCKFYWMRLTDAACDNLLASNGDKLIDPDIKRKYNIKTCRNKNVISTYEEKETVKKNGDVKIEKTNVKEFCTVLSCSTFYNTKGVGYYDSEYTGEYVFVLDEMNREQSERNSFDIVYNFTNLLENIARFTKSKIRVIMIGNTLDEASDLLTAFNFIPNGFGRFKLKKKRAIIDNIMPNENHEKHRKGSIADILTPTASTFTNEVQIDASLLCNRREAITPVYVIKFKKTPDTWYTLYNDNIIKPYNNEQKPVVAMQRYLDAVYDADRVRSIVERFDARAFRFVSLSCLKTFQKNLRLLKKS